MWRHSSWCCAGRRRLRRRSRRSTRTRSTTAPTCRSSTSTAPLSRLQPTPQPGDIAVTFSSRGYTTRRVFNPCWREKHLHAAGHGWRATIAATELDWPTVHVRVLQRLSGRVRIRYRVVVGDALVESGAIVTRVRQYPGHDVYEGSDEFTNFCLNEDRTVYSRDGRLYCHWPGYVVRRTTITPDRS